MKDILGNEIMVGSTVLFPRHTHLYKGVVTKICRKKINVKRLDDNVCFNVYGYDVVCYFGISE